MEPRVITDVDEAIQVMQNSTTLGIDIETSGFRPWADKVAVISMAADPKVTTDVAVLSTRGHIPDGLKRFIEDRELLIAHNAVGFDAAFLHYGGVDVFKPKWYDTMTAEQVTITSDRSNVLKGLAYTIKRRCGVDVIAEKKAEKHDSWMAPVLTPQQLHYCTIDVRYLHRIRQAQWTELDIPQRKHLALEQDIFSSVVKMQINGLPVHFGKLAEALVQAEIRREEARAQLPPDWQAINMRSPIQIVKLCEKWGIKLPTTEKTAATTWLRHMQTTKDPEMLKLCWNILRYKEADQVLKMYDEEWRTQFVDSSSRIHARFNPCGTDTGRFSSSEPNMQQIVKPMRYVFGSDNPDLWVVSCDYSQIEVRLAAAIASTMGKDETFLKAVGEEDVHAAIAGDVFGIPVGQVTKEQRSLAKNLSFTLLFGGGVDMLHTWSNDHGSLISRDTADELMQAFFEKYKGVARVRQRAIQQARYGKPLPLTLPSGLKRTLMGKYEGGGEDGGYRRMTLNPQTILNTMIQGAAAAGMKYAIQKCKEADLDQYLSLTVHDELVATINGTQEQAEELAREIEQCMLVGMKKVDGKVPLKAEWEVGHAWGKKPEGTIFDRSNADTMYKLHGERIGAQNG